LPATVHPLGGQEADGKKKCWNTPPTGEKRKPSKLPAIPKLENTCEVARSGSQDGNDGNTAPRLRRPPRLVINNNSGTGQSLKDSSSSPSNSTSFNRTIEVKRLPLSVTPTAHAPNDNTKESENSMALPSSPSNSPALSRKVEVKRSPSGRILIGAEEEYSDGEDDSFRRQASPTMEQKRNRFLIEVKSAENLDILRSALKSRDRVKSISDFVSEKESQNSPRTRRVKFADELGIPCKLERIRYFLKNEEIHRNSDVLPEIGDMARSRCCTVS